MKRLLFTILILLLPITVIGAAPNRMAQETPECDTTAALRSIVEAAMTATDDNALEVLTQIGDQIAQLKVMCSGLTFEGSSDEVVGPLEFPEGIYRATLTTPGFASITVTVLDGECGGGSGSFLTSVVFGAFRDDATNGMEAVFSSTGCEALIEISNLSDPPYLLEFELVR